MTILEACKELHIWDVVRGYAEVWLGSNNSDSTKVKILAKNQFKQLARQYHPDMSTGDNEKYLRISEALDIILNAKVTQIISALEEDRAADIKYYKPGDSQCRQCTKWNTMFDNCVFPACSGFDQNTFTFVKTEVVHDMASRK
jgi:hypothetical protein